MKDFKKFMEYLQENKIPSKIFNEAKKNGKIGETEMFISFLLLLEEYHNWVERDV